jgi:hypothetical protein
LLPFYYRAILYSLPFAVSLSSDCSGAQRHPLVNLQVHQALMVGRLTPFDPVYVERLAAATKALAPQSGPVLAQAQAHGQIYSTLLSQSISVSIWVRLWLSCCG